MNTYIIISIIVIPLIATIYCRSNYSKYSKIKSKGSLCGQEIARKILDNNGLNNVYVVEVKGTLTDHYDSRLKVVRLSSEVFHGDSIASLAIAAHECGHAIQDKEGYFFLKLRSLIYPVVNICSSISYYVMLLAFILRLTDLLYIGIALIAVGLIFQIITLPVEFNASSRATKELSRTVRDNNSGYQSMLRSAAYTYVAGVLANAMQLLYYIGLARRD